MTELKGYVPVVALAFLLSLGLTACGEEGVEQQSQSPATEQSDDAAAAIGQPDDAAATTDENQSGSTSQ